MSMLYIMCDQSLMCSLVFCLPKMLQALIKQAEMKYSFGAEIPHTTSATLSSQYFADLSLSHQWDEGQQLQCPLCRIASVAQPGSSKKGNKSIKGLMVSFTCRSLSSPEKWLLMSTRKKAGKCPMDPWCQQMGSTQSGLRALPQVWHREQNQVGANYCCTPWS